MMGSISRLTRFWWLQLPIAVSRISNNLSIMFIDGIYTIAWQRFAAFLPLAILIVGVISGLERFGSEELFTQSFVILIVSIIFGTFGSQFGIMFMLGFIISDLFLYQSPDFRYYNYTLEEQIKLFVAKLITYVGLGMISLVIPFLARILALQMPYSRIASLKIRLCVNIITSAVACFILISIFMQALAILIRPFYIWIGTLPPVNSVFPVQEQAWVFALTGSVIIVTRIVIEQISTRRRPKLMVEFLKIIEQKQAETKGIKIPKIIKILLISSVSTFLLSGLLASESEFQFFILFVSLLAIGIFRWCLTKFIPRFAFKTERIPLILRLSLTLIVSVLISAYLLQGNLMGLSFQPIVTSLLLSLTCMAIIFPEPTENFRKKIS
jgi:hypothetical protein